MRGAEDLVACGASLGLAKPLLGGRGVRHAVSGFAGPGSGGERGIVPRGRGDAERIPGAPRIRDPPRPPGGLRALISGLLPGQRIEPLRDVPVGDVHLEDRLEDLAGLLPLAGPLEQRAVGVVDVLRLGAGERREVLDGLLELLEGQAGELLLLEALRRGAAGSRSCAAGPGPSAGTPPRRASTSSRASSVRPRRNRSVRSSGWAFTRRRVLLALRLEEDRAWSAAAASGSRCVVGRGRRRRPAPRARPCCSRRSSMSPTRTERS